MKSRGPLKRIAVVKKRLSRCVIIAKLLCLLLFIAPGPRSQKAQTLPVPKVESSNQTQKTDDLPQLELDKPIEREISGPQAHTYDIKLTVSQYVELSVEQRNINLLVVLYGPDSNKLFEVDREKRHHGTELVTFIADVPGNYRIEVRPAEKNAASGRYEAKILAQRAPTPDERTLEEARRLFEEARDLRQKGKYDDALLLSERALGIREKVLGPEHPEVADSLNLIAIIYDDKHDYGKAEPLNDRALTIREQVLGPDHPDVARSLFNLAWIYKVRQDFAKAESFYRRALTIQEKSLGEYHTEVATTLNDLAILYNQKGDREKSILMNQRVLAIREKALGPDDSGVAKALNNLARAYELKGDYPKAESLFGQALTIWEKALGPEHPEVAFALDGLGRVASLQGDFVKAEPFSLRALALREKTLGPDHPEVATTLYNLAALYLLKGDYARAEPLLQRDLAITESKLGREHRFAAPTLSSLASIYKHQGDFFKAESSLQRALAIREKALGPNHSDVGWSLYLLGRLYAENKKSDVAKAESLLQRSLLTLEKALGPEHHRVASALSGLAMFYASKGEFARAEAFYNQALAIQERVLGPDHPDVAESLAGLGNVYRALGSASQAITCLSRSYDIRERNLYRNLPIGSERQKLDYLKLFAEDIDLALSLHTQWAPHNSDALQLALNTLLRRKGRALDAMTDNIALLRRRALPQDQDLFRRLSTVRSQLAMVTLRGPAGTTVDTYRSQLKRLEDELDQLEADISSRSSEFRAEQRPITLELVESVIPDGAVLVEFALYRPVAQSAAAQLPLRYAAYLLTNQGVHWTDLGDASGIDLAVRAWHEALRNPQRAEVRELARTVDARVMQPVRALVGPSQHLLISADGLLNLIPFAALVDEQGRYLIERYAITYLTSGRDLLRLQVPRRSRSNPLIVAAPAFGEPALVEPSEVSSGRSRKNGGRPLARKQIDYSQVFFGPLPGVADEVRALKELLPQATLLLKEQATEAAIKRVSGPTILHVATHGFFLQDDQSVAASVKLTGSNMRLGKWAAWVENPLLRSGLALAGANQGRSGDDDGVLTALEAAGLDLWGTELVVLSACDTGVGEIKNGEGVYGLRRALVLAGAKSQMSSLWPVSDRSTRDLMIGYYKRLTQGEGRSEALRQVQLQMLQNKSRSHPFYWASFIQSGEWANLEGRR